MFQQIVNTSISNAVFPQELKYSIVKPTIKNPSLDPEVFNNFRPLFCIPFLPKFIEQALHLQLDNYLQQNKLYSFYQSAYRRDYSCETALFKLIDDLQTFQHQDKNVVIILLDQSAAFDTVDHGKLIDKLEHNFGIQGNALLMLKSYLEHRTFSVDINNHLSSPKLSKYGVPQGSLLGPLFYSLYTHDIDQIALKHDFHIQIYADDCQIYKPFIIDNLKNVESKLQNCLNDIKTYMSQNYLMLNKDKTLVKIFWHKKSDPNTDKFLKFDLQHNIKVLGVNLEDCYKFNTFIQNKVKICNMHLRNLNNIRDSLDTSTRILLITQLILSTIDYCNILLIACNDKELKPLKLIMNRSIRFIFNLKFRQHVTPFYNKCHFLKIKYRILFKSCLTAHKIYHRKAPTYLEDKIQRYKPTIQSMTLRTGPGRDTFMFTTGHNEKKSLINIIKTNWNNLPLELRKYNNTSTFKEKLKTHIMSLQIREI